MRGILYLNIASLFVNSLDALLIYYVPVSQNLQVNLYFWANWIEPHTDYDEVIEFRPQIELNIDKHDIINLVFQAIRSAKDLKSLRQNATSDDLGSNIRNGLLNNQGRLEGPYLSAY